MASELSQIRDLNRKVVEYHTLASEVVIFQKDLDHFGGAIYSQPEVPFMVGIANFGIDEVIKLEGSLQPTLNQTNETAEEKLTAEQEEFGKTVARDFLNEIRAIVRDHGFEELSTANNEVELAKAQKRAIQTEKSKKINDPSEYTLSLIHI